MADDFDKDEALANAQTLIEAQKKELETLRASVKYNHNAQVLRDIYMVLATRTVAMPVSHTSLLKMIVTTAAQVMSAQAAWLFLLDKERQELFFEVAIGPYASEVKRHRLSIDQGIAGFVLQSGQPLAVVDAGQHSLHASEIAPSTDYFPYSILGLPLFYKDEVIGVLELLDKEGREPFDGRDMDFGALFADQAAVAIELSRIPLDLTQLFEDLFQHIDSGSETSKEMLLQYTNAFAQKLDEDGHVKDALELATLLQELVCKEIL